MERGDIRWVIVGTMLLFDAIVGVAVAVLVNPIAGAIAFVVSASISLWTSRKVVVSGGRGGSSAPEPAPVSEDPAPAEAPDPAADPSYNPYARED
jgi:hypothetical protein